MDSFDFPDIAPVEKPVKIGSKDYTLREASTEAARRYRNQLFRSTKFADGQVASVEGMGDIEPLLVSLCLYEQYTDAKGATKERTVPLPTVLSWPSRVTKKYFDWIKLVSDLDEKETVETLEKRLADTEKRLEKLRKEGKDKEEDSSKNSQSSTEAISVSAESLDWTPSIS